jgi:hypothetical protein
MIRHESKVAAKSVFQMGIQSDHGSERYSEFFDNPFRMSMTETSTGDS